MSRPAINPSLEICITRVLLVATLVPSVMVLDAMRGALVGASSIAEAVDACGFLLIFAFLLYGSLSYHATRIGYFKRLRTHVRVKRSVLERVYEGAARPVTFLVPSYKEELPIVRQTLMSAALQECPNRRVVLLIDDPCDVSDRASLRAIDAARALPREIELLVSEPAKRLDIAHSAFLSRARLGACDIKDECERLAELYTSVADWFDAQAKAWHVRDHTDRFFVETILRGPARKHRRRAVAMARIAASSVSRAHRQIAHEYLRLAQLFTVELTSFQRKRFDNLSHEPNKAMNLNSYIGLIGGIYREVRVGLCVYLEPCAAEDSTLIVPACEYIVTLDADSVLLPDYALRLVHLMNEPGNERIAVAQTPYSAIPGPKSGLERIAGATTDIQYVIHQGFTHHGATFWVGANALLRRAALDDIVTEDTERGHVVKRFVQDRTVIEDTESTVDLIDRNWTLHNYPERLSYSATPADFGALVIQRARWANGGLIILPKLLRYLMREPGNLHRLREGFFRIHYLTSIAGVNIGLLVVLLYRFPESFQNLWLPLTALPYYVAYARDLRLAGYRRVADLLHVYALNLLLLPVNLGGVAKSLRQAVTKRKSAFQRTPKVSNRTCAPASHIAALYAVTLYCVVAAAVDWLSGHWLSGAFALVNAGIFTYSIGHFIGWRESIQDLRSGGIGRGITLWPRTWIARDDVARGLHPMRLSTSTWSEH